jgi:carbon storage regulator
MLILTRHAEEDIVICIGDGIVIKIVEIRGDKVRIGITAPTEIPVHRREIYEAIKRGESRDDRPAVDRTLPND